MRVSFDAAHRAWSGYPAFLADLVDRTGVVRVCEIGGGANPSVGIETIARKGLEYTILDISHEELSKAPAGYRKIVADIADPQFEPNGEFDLVFSRMLAEHVRSGEIFHRNVLKLLSPGGIAFHFFPTLYALPFVLNALLPEAAGSWILRVIQGGREREGRQAKFPARYSWCRGPTTRQIRRFEALGYKVDTYIGFFGHGGYFQKFPAIERAHAVANRRFVNLLLRWPVPDLTSFSYVVLRRPT